MVGQDYGIDLESYSEEPPEGLTPEQKERIVDLDEQKDPETHKPTMWETVGDVLVQSGRGILRAFTWPADLLKVSMMGEALSDIDEVEEAFKKAGKPFDREKYVKDVFDASGFVPTQDVLEKKFEDITGVSLEPKTESGKVAGRFSEVASFSPGSLGRKLASGLVGTGTSEALKGAGLGETASNVAGDVLSSLARGLRREPRVLSPEAQKLSDKAQKHSLPFIELMAREKSPLIRGKISEATSKQLKDDLGISSEMAIKKIIEDQIPISKLKEKGINLKSLSSHAYEKTREMAKKSNKKFDTKNIVSSIDDKIKEIKSLAPSPSESQKEAIRVLQRERDILSVSKPTAEQLINQHINYNSDLKSLYKKPEFSGKEEEVRKAYHFLNSQLVKAMEDQGSKEVANAFRASNKIYTESSKLSQTENIISKAFLDGYDPKKLDQILGSRNGAFLRRNLGEKGVEEIKEVAKYGKLAKSRMEKFLSNNSMATQNYVESLGVLAPFIFLPHSLIATGLSLIKPLAGPVQGRILSRPATRDAYKLSLKHASEGFFNLLKKDIRKIELELIKEFGSIENFIEDTTLEIYAPNQED